MNTPSECPVAHAPEGRSLLTCPQCLDNMVSLSDQRFHCARCKSLWTWESTAAEQPPTGPP